MTFATLTRAQNAAFGASLSEALYHLVQTYDDNRQFRRTVRELRDLNDAQLADMGVHRSEITRVARDAVYGTAR